MNGKTGSGPAGTSWFIKIFNRLASALGFSKGRRGEQAGTGDVAVRLSRQRTDYSLERSYLASERTLMAWIRTALSMISFGFTIGKMGQVLHDIKIKGMLGNIRTVSIRELAYFLVILGTVALLGAAGQHMLRVHELYKTVGLRRQVSITFIVALLLVAVGIFALTSLVLAI